MAEVRPGPQEILARPTETSPVGDKESITQTTHPDGGGDKHALDVEILGGSVKATPSGLTIGGLITEVLLSSGSWTLLPAVNLTDRNGLGFQNNTADEIVVNFADLGGSFVGWHVKPGGEFFIDVADSIDIYAKALTNAPTIVVMEVA